jgi:glycosyltransferase involved in cell wall biosynthesis
MRIAVNTRLLLKNRLDGIGWYKYHTLKRITAAHPEHEFYFIFDRAFDPEFIFSPNIIPVTLFPPARHPLLWFTWFEISIPLILNKIKPDLFLSPDGYLSLSTKVPSVPVIHDINFQHRPQDLPLSSRLYYRSMFPKFARKARRIATVSEYSKKDISESYGVIPDKIDVTYNGSHELYKPLDEVVKKRTRDRYSQGNPYFIFIGSLHPRKNIERLLQAFELFKSAKSSNIRLLIAGGDFFGTGTIFKLHEKMRFRDEVQFTGRLDPLELRDVLGSALAMAYVPLFEGFGIPLVEAMNSDVPIIASNVTSVPEIAGDAALFADPYDVSSIASAFQQMADSPELQKSYIEKGRIRRQAFSWDLTSQKLWDCMMKAIDK